MVLAHQILLRPTMKESWLLFWNTELKKFNIKCFKLFTIALSYSSTKNHCSGIIFFSKIRFWRRFETSMNPKKFYRPSASIQP